MNPASHARTRVPSPCVTGIRAHGSSSGSGPIERLPCPVPAAKGTGCQGQRRAGRGPRLRPRPAEPRYLRPPRVPRQPPSRAPAGSAGRRGRAAGGKPVRAPPCPPVRTAGPEPEPRRAEPAAAAAALTLSGAARPHAPPCAEGRGGDVIAVRAEGRPGAILVLRAERARGGSAGGGDRAAG